MLRVFAAKLDGYELLARAVKLAWGMDVLLEILRAEGGKPYFKDYPERHFNLSHSGEFALCALSDAPVGADIEVVRPRKDGLPAYTFKGVDYERYLALGGDWDAFYTLWTEVESIIKYTGEGLKAYRRADLPGDCVISDLSGDGWKAAVCAHETVERLEWLGGGNEMNVYEFWRAVLAQDEPAIRGYFRPDAHVNWHCTNEHFTVDEFIVANCEYPGDWDGKVERVERLDDLLITVTRVWPREKTVFFHVTSFIRLLDGKIASVDEYWADDGDAPKWRQDKHIGKPIR